MSAVPPEPLGTVDDVESLEHALTTSATSRGHDEQLRCMEDLEKRDLRHRYHSAEPARAAKSGKTAEEPTDSPQISALIPNQGPPALHTRGESTTPASRCRAPRAD